MTDSNANAFNVEDAVNINELSAEAVLDLSRQLEEQRATAKLAKTKRELLGDFAMNLLEKSVEAPKLTYTYDNKAICDVLVDEASRRMIGESFKLSEDELGVLMSHASMLKSRIKEMQTQRLVMRKKANELLVVPEGTPLEEKQERLGMVGELGKAWLLLKKEIERYKATEYKVDAKGKLVLPRL